MRLRSILLVLVPLAACAPADDADADGTGSTPPASASVPAPAPEGATPSAAGPEAPEPEADEPRVVFLGTSLTAGMGLARESDRYTARLGALADSAGLRVRIVNAGVSGATSAGGLRRLDWLLEEPVDVLVVELGANDALRGQDPGATEENLRAVVERTRARSPEARIVLLGMQAPPNLGERYTTAFRTLYERVARDLGTERVDFLLEGVAGVPALNQPDGIHPNAEGHALMARNVWPVLEPVLREVAAGEDGGGAR